MQLNAPAIIGFGITDQKSFDKACEYAAGAIVGTRFVKLLEEDGYIDKIPEFVNSIRPLEKVE